MKKLLFGAIAAVFALAGLTSAVVPAYADTTNPAFDYIDQAKPEGMTGSSADDGLMATVKNIINTVIGVVGVAAVIMMIIGGISFITSQGDTAKVTKARNTILYGVVGLIVALLAFAIVNFVLSGIFSASESIWLSL